MELLKPNDEHSGSHRAACLSIWAVMFLTYAATAARSLVGADNGEFVTLSVAPGVAHPSGYPLYVIYLRAFSWLPGLNPAHTAAIATAILGAAAIAVLYSGLRRWGWSAGPSAAAVIIAGLDLIVWTQHTHAEPFALNDLIAAGLIWAAAPGAPRRGISRAATLGFIGGLGLSNHLSIVLLAPVGLWGLYLAARESRRVILTLLAAGLPALVGLSIYFYLMWSTTDCLSCLQWGSIHTFGDLWRHFTRADYGSTKLLPSKKKVSRLLELRTFAVDLWDDSHGIVPVLTAAGAIWLGIKDRRRAVIFCLTLVLAGPVFVAMFNIDPKGIGHSLVRRFYVLPVFLSAPFLASALEWIRERLSSVDGRAFGVVVALLIAGMATFAPVVFSRDHGVIVEYAHDMIDPLPPNSILLGTGDDRLFGVAYIQEVEHDRPDVAYLDGKLLASKWYVDRMNRRFKVKLPYATPTSIFIDTIAATLASTRRPVFFTHAFTPWIRKTPTYPYGVVIRLATSIAKPPHPIELARQNAEIFGKLRLDVPYDRVTDPWEREAYDHYQNTWTSLAGVLDQIGDKEGAARALQTAKLYGWKPGEKKK